MGEAARHKDFIPLVAVGNDQQFRQFCTVIQRPELSEDPRYLTNADRVGNRQALVETSGVALEHIEDRAASAVQPGRAPLARASD